MKFSAKELRRQCMNSSSCLSLILGYRFRFLSSLHTLLVLLLEFMDAHLIFFSEKLSLFLSFYNVFFFFLGNG